MIPQVAASLSGSTSAVPSQPKSMRRGPVVIHRLRNVIPRDNEYSFVPHSSTSNKDEMMTTPLIGTNEDKVLSYLSTKSLSSPHRPGDEDNNLLWSVINIAAQNRGRLRNDKLAKRAIVDLLLATTTKKSSEEKTNGGSFGHKSAPPHPTSSNVDEVQELLLRGERESAVSEALTNKNYALALLIASMCDRTTYQIAARRYADEALPVGSPLHTATLLFSDNLDIPRDEELMDPKASGESSFWCGEEYGNLEESWKRQLASILSNQTVGWERIVLTLGDRLLKLGQVQAAHVCYLVSFCHFGSPTQNSTRLVLLGCDHRISMNRLLMTPESIESFERTEALEWARRRGNKKTHIPVLQPFKYRYAEILSDLGYEDLAREYLLSIRSCIGLGSGGSSDKLKVNVSQYGGEEFIESLKMLDDRICVSIGAEQSSWDTNGDEKVGAASALGSIVKSVLGKKSKTVVKAVVDEVEGPLREPELSMPPQPAAAALPKKVPETPAATIMIPESVPDGGGDDSFITCKEAHIAEQPPPAAAAAAAVDNDTFKSSPVLLSNPFSQDSAEPSHQGPPSSAPPMFGGDTMLSSNRDYKSKVSSEEKKNEHQPSFLSTPVQATKKDGDGKKKAPVSEPVTAPRSSGWLSKLLGRDAESNKAKVADVGEDMQAYYDEKLKRWIFPGDDPAEVAKPLAPPPIIPKTTDNDAAGATPTQAPAPSSDDPLAALMAPPPMSRGRSPKKKVGNTPLAGRYADPLSSIGNVSSNKLPPASPMMNQPPTFAVFKPKPAPAEQEE